MAAIPVALIVLYLVFGGQSAPSSSTETKRSVSRSSTQGDFRPADGQSVQVIDYESESPAKDFDRIYQFITTKYSSISLEDARLISQYLVDYGQVHRIDPKFVAALVARESSFNKRAVSSTGAKGLGQIKSFNFESLHITDPFNIEQNVSGTTQYIKSMIMKWPTHRYQTHLGLASYFKGFGAISRSNQRLDRQTRGYVSDILNIYKQL